MIIPHKLRGMTRALLVAVAVVLVVAVPPLAMLQCPGACRCQQ
ncbi:MAG: hypothetical protein U9N46_07115 [Euryarchaeota archaeon]|nr:hypothetical protein [Euryarchaeota archaeon]